MMSSVKRQRFIDTQRSLAAVTSQNERLAETLREARDQIVTLKEEVDRLAQPPTGFGTFLQRNEDDSVDVFTGGRKLLSDAAMLAALSTGAEVCCFEIEARRFPLLTAMGVREALPKELAEVLRSQNWPIPLEEVRKKDRDRPLSPLLRRLKSMDLVRLEGREEPMVCLTERGKACLEWIIRAGRLTGSPE